LDVTIGADHGPKSTGKHVSAPGKLTWPKILKTRKALDRGPKSADTHVSAPGKLTWPKILKTKKALDSGPKSTDKHVSAPGKLTRPKIFKKVLDCWLGKAHACPSASECMFKLRINEEN